MVLPIGSPNPGRILARGYVYIVAAVGHIAPFRHGHSAPFVLEFMSLLPVFIFIRFAEAISCIDCPAPASLLPFDSLVGLIGTLARKIRKGAILMTLRTFYEIKKTKFLLWKNNVGWTWTALFAVILGSIAAGAIVALHVVGR